MENKNKELKINGVQRRISKDKELLVEQLTKTPIIQIACEKLGIGRATYYRWRNEDPDFTKLADESLREGCSLVNDMAESQLLSAIRDKNMTAIIFWLKNHHSAYTPKLELTRPQAEELTEEQKENIERTLRLTGIGKSRRKKKI